MIRDINDTCPDCGGKVRYRDKTKRIIKSEYGQSMYIMIPRYKCIECKKIHRLLPNNLKPYKHYRADIIDGMINNIITCDDLPYEDWPTPLTVERWKKFNT